MAPPQKQVPLAKLSVLWGMFFAVLASDLAKNRVPCGSPAYAAAVLAIVPVLGAIVWAVRRRLVHEYRERLRLGMPFAEGEVTWDERHSVVYPAVSTLAGVVAGMFGVGGGIVKGPLMLAMGVPADVAAATSATMILFTALSASVIYISFGAVKLDYGVAVATVGFLCTLVGQFVVYRMVKMLGRRSIIIIVMVAFMALSASVVTIQAVFVTRDAIQEGDLWRMHGIC